MIRFAGLVVVIGLALGTLLIRAPEGRAQKSATVKVQQTGGTVTLADADGKTVLRYQLQGGTHKKLSVQSACFFHPFTTPSGVVVTEVAPDDHPHHRGIFLAFVEMHGEKDADFWGWGEHAPKDGRVIVNRAVSASQNGDPGFVARNVWAADGKTMIRERLSATLRQANDRTNILDLQYTLVPAADVTLSRWAFSGFCVRTRKDAELVAYGPDGEAKLPNPSHVKPESDWPAEPWYAYELRLKDNTTAGVAVIEHPDNPPSLWHNHRDIRMLNPSIVAPKEVKLQAMQPLVLGYRVVAYDGKTPTEELNRLAKAFAAVR
jgi:hypothetical protein